MVGSCFSLPMNITLRTAAAISMTPLQALHSGGFVQVPDQQNSAACSLRYLSQPHEDRTDFVCPVHVHVGTEIRLDRVDDDQSGVVLDDGFFNSFVRKRQLHIAVVNDQHPGQGLHPLQSGGA